MTNSVLRFAPSGARTTVIGNLDGPAGIAVDGAGNIFVSLVGPRTIAKITPALAVTTFASGFSNPVGLAFDASGNLFACDFGTDSIEKISPSGVVTNFASDLNGVRQLAFDPAGNLYASVFATRSIVRIAPDGTVVPFADDVLGGGVAVEPPVTAPRITSITRLSNGHILVQGLCSPNAIGPVLETSATGRTGTYTFLAPITVNPGGSFSYDDAAAGGSKKFYRVVVP
jgi:hypothetical protein